MENERYWFNNVDPEHIKDMLTDAYERVYFQYKNKDYVIEWLGHEIGYIIVEPFLYEKEGGCANETDAAYPGHLQAKTPEEFMSLPFLDGKTFFERFNELRFFEWQTVI